MTQRRISVEEALAAYSKLGARPIWGTAEDSEGGLCIIEALRRANGYAMFADYMRDISWQYAMGVRDGWDDDWRKNYTAYDYVTGVNDGRALRSALTGATP